MVYRVIRIAMSVNPLDICGEKENIFRRNIIISLSNETMNTDLCCEQEFKNPDNLKSHKLDLFRKGRATESIRTSQRHAPRSAAQTNSASFEVILIDL